MDGANILVCACSNWGDTSGCQSRGEDLNVDLLILSNVHEVVVVVRSIACISEILSSEVLERALVEYVLKMLER